MATLERAIALAAAAHAGQVDKAGAPYILHPLRLLLAVDTPEERIVAVLHDVVEDTPWTLEGLRAEGFTREVVDAVEALTKRTGECYEAFIDRVAANPLARQVKRADLTDNLDLGRLPVVTEADLARLTRYRAALARLGQPSP